MLACGCSVLTRATAPVSLLSCCSPSRPVGRADGTVTTRKTDWAILSPRSAATGPAKSKRSPGPAPGTPATSCSSSSSRPGRASHSTSHMRIPRYTRARRRQQVTPRVLISCRGAEARSSDLRAACRRGGFLMPRPDKVEQVELLTEKLRSARVAVLTDYRGLTVGQLQDLRGRLRAQDVEYRVVKNTLARRAAVEAGHPDFQSQLKGPVAIAFGGEDIG